MKYFPIFLESKKITAIVIGGGDIAARKIELLLKATSNITIISPEVSSSVDRLITTNGLTWLAQPYQTGLLSAATLVIAATNNSQVNRAISVEANSLNIIVNVVDQPELCTYITPAIIDRSPMLIALSSSGSSPILLRMLKEKIEKVLPYNYGKLAEFAFKFREKVKLQIAGLSNKRYFWENCLQGPIGKLVLADEMANAEKLLLESLQHKVCAPMGSVAFIFTNGGNPDHLTLEAYQEMQNSDAVFYDSKVNHDFIEYVRRDAAKHPQELLSTQTLNIQHVASLVEQGQKVVYLLATHVEIPDSMPFVNGDFSKKILVSGQ